MKKLRLPVKVLLTNRFEMNEKKWSYFFLNAFLFQAGKPAIVEHGVVREARASVAASGNCRGSDEPVRN